MSPQMLVISTTYKEPLGIVIGQLKDRRGFTNSTGISQEENSRFIGIFGLSVCRKCSKTLYPLGAKPIAVVIEKSGDDRQSLHTRFQHRQGGV